MTGLRSYPRGWPFGLVYLAVAGCHAAPATSPPGATIEWPTPPGWKSETIPFPLDFAQDIAHTGTEEIRFAPHFFDVHADTYFTYTFAWVLTDERPVTPDALALELPRYFRGLARAVGAEKDASHDPGAFSARVQAVDATHARGTVQMVDPFSDGRALSLNLDAEWEACGGRRVVLVSLSPHPPGDATWSALIQQRGTFRCVAGTISQP